MVEFDNQVPIIAHPGTDRRQSVPGYIREEFHDALDRIGTSSEQRESIGRPSNSKRASAFASNSNIDIDDPGQAAVLRNPNDFFNLEPPSEDAQSVSGPSFLGLGSGAPYYDYEEPEEQAGHMRRKVALAALFILVALAAVQWRSLRDIGVRYAHAKMMLGKKAADQSNSAPVPVTPLEKPNIAGDKPNQKLAPAPTIPDEPAQVAPSDETASSKADQEATSKKGDAADSASEPSRTANRKPSVKHASKPEFAEPRESIPGQAELARADRAGSPEIAAMWLWRATRNGNPDAPVRLADMYISGRGVPQNCEQATVLLRSAAAKPNARARSKLGALYATGHCVSLNRVEAYRWLSLALKADPGSEWTEHYRDRLWVQMSNSERMQAKVP